MNEMAQIISQTILVRDLQKEFSKKCRDKYSMSDKEALFKLSGEMTNQEKILDTMLENYVKAFDGLMTIENRTETHILPNQLSLEL